ncbi:hypothetical protein H6F46_10970 [Limnothrix sp. FACHB-1083]|uniref:hypothetical protein n=1 Tax=unclassified Limnothrix TaxID=2632864 RepID=UPI0016811569|nr:MULTISPECIES: hypothetical protein [unclassified Limnothrix]MBD2161213.1 hypothetical protein [Limnothrix sp. FACHB-1083]MBD2192423.1 hypothetical protein [Limnothrix sp. FACHB-1088]
MFTDLLPLSLHVDAALLASSGLWSFALYLALPAVSDRLMDLLIRWFDFAERSLYFSTEEFEKTRTVRESQNAFYASIFSVIPFLGFGFLVHLFLSQAIGTVATLGLSGLASATAGVWETMKPKNSNQK